MQWAPSTSGWHLLRVPMTKRGPELWKESFQDASWWFIWWIILTYGDDSSSLIITMHREGLHDDASSWCIMTAQCYRASSWWTAMAHHNQSRWLTMISLHGDDSSRCITMVHRSEKLLWCIMLMRHDDASKWIRWFSMMSRGNSSWLTRMIHRDKSLRGILKGSPAELWPSLFHGHHQ